MPRKIIQIAAIPAVMDNDTQDAGYTRHGERVYALCEDGTVWVCEMGIDAKEPWSMLPLIPAPRL